MHPCFPSASSVSDTAVNHKDTVLDESEGNSTCHHGMEISVEEKD